MSIENNIKDLQDRFSKDLLLVKEGKLNLEEFKVTYLGRKGRLASIFSTLNELSSNDKPKAGVLLNDLKNEFNNKIDALSLNLKSKTNSTNIDADLTLPGDPYLIGSVHPLTHILNEIESIFNN